MCGIICIWSFDGPVREEELSNLAGLLKHRGPDDTGTHLINTQVGFAHARLSIIDLSSRAHQPMLDRVTGNVIAYNGEIYNYRELREELCSKGHEFQSDSDTEVLLKAYAQWGPDCLDRLQGMFAFGLWDETRKTIFAARDRIGIKPLYYLQDPHRLMLASEIKVFQPYLRQTGNLRLNENALPFYLTMRCAPTGETLMGQVRRVTAGCFLLAGDRTLEKKPYWRLKDHAAERSVSEDEALEELEGRLTLAVKRRLVADVPVGSFLSGGVDSSLITMIASKQSSSPIHSFSVDFDDAKYSERPHFDYVSGLAKTESHVFTLNSQKFLEFLDDWVWFMDDLVSDPSSLPLYFVANEARRHNIKVVLSGEGADELFGGYESYTQVLRLNSWRPLARSLSWARKFMTSSIDEQDVIWRIGSSFPFRGTAYVFGESYRNRFLKRDFHLDPWIDEVNNQSRSLTPINRMLYFDLATRIPSDLLIRTDRVTMAASVECRVPFLDHELVEAMIGIPEQLKINNRVGKYLLKRLARRFFKEDMVYRPKMGFSTPLGAWFRRDLRPLLERIFLREKLLDCLNYRSIEAMLKEFWQGGGRHEARIWNLLALELWHRRWIQ